MTMYNPPHVGEVLKDLYLDPLELTITEVSGALGVTRQTLSELVNGKIGVSAEMAMKLSKAFATTPEMWVNLQTQYELWQVRNINLSLIKCFIEKKKRLK